MKLSNETISVLKNFGAINQGILFKKGKTLKTVSSHKNILAEVDIKEDIPAEFGIYDLNNFLSVISLHKDDPSFEFDDKQVTIVGNKGRSKIKYRFTPANMIVTPPEKALTMPDAEIKFDLTAEDFDWVLRAAGVLASPQIAIESDGKKVSVVTLDLQNDSAHTDALEIANGNGNKYKMIFKTENITKVLAGTYEVSISSKGISHFKNKNLPLQYWITTEQGSKFEKVA
jgi:predicted transcriptional regulator